MSLAAAAVDGRDSSARLPCYNQYAACLPAAHLAATQAAISSSRLLHASCPQAAVAAAAVALPTCSALPAPAPNNVNYTALRRSWMSRGTRPVVVFFFVVLMILFPIGMFAGEPCGPPLLACWKQAPGG